MNALKRIKKRTIKRIVILGTCISVPVVTLATVFVVTGGKKKIDFLNKAKEIYNTAFVSKGVFKEKSLLSENASKILDDIYKSFSNPGDAIVPSYTHNVVDAFTTSDNKYFYQFLDQSFQQGTGIFANWKNKVIFICENNKIVDIQYKTLSKQIGK